MKSITVPATLEGPGLATEFIEQELAEHNCSPKVLNQIAIAIEEVLVNVASYAGLSADEGAEVCCEVLEDPPRVVMQFRDGGIPFDPLAREDPDRSPDALLERVGGLGIFMVKTLMDDVSYAYENGKNTLTMLKHLQ